MEKDGNNKQALNKEMLSVEKEVERDAWEVRADAEQVSWEARERV